VSKSVKRAPLRVAFVQEDGSALEDVALEAVKAYDAGQPGIVLAQLGSTSEAEARRFRFSSMDVMFLPEPYAARVQEIVRECVAAKLQEVQP